MLKSKQILKKSRSNQKNIFNSKKSKGEGKEKSESSDCEFLICCAL